jgi:hypothetical protein
MIDWMKVKNWLEFYGHINSNWDCVAVSEDSFYAEDKMENTFISLFQRGGCELVAIVGMLHPHISVGGSTGITLYSHENVTWFLEDNLENMYDELMEKAMNEVNG